MLRFRDNGCGMAEEILANLFEKDVTNDGHGIGLTFCMKAMHKMEDYIRWSKCRR